MNSSFVVFIQLAISGLVIGSVYGLIALGYSLIYKASGLMNFCQGDMLSLGAFLGYTFYGVLRLPFIVSLVFTIVIVFMFGILLEKIVIRKLLNKNLMAIYIVLATIAVSYIIQNGSMFVWGNRPLTFPAIFSIVTIKVFGIGIQTEPLACIIVGIIIMGGLHLFMTRTKFGTAMRAAAMDPKAAKACGIDVSLSTGVTWGLAAGVAAIGGMFIGPIYGVFALLGVNIGRKSFTSAVVGGYGNMYGAIVGGVSLGLVETLVAGYISSAYKDLIAYILLLVFLFIKPTGIFNEKAITE